MNKESPPADAPVPPQGTEQAADQAAQQQQPPAEEQSALDTAGNIVDGVTDVADVVGTVFDIFG